MLLEDVGFGWPSVNGGLVRMPNAEKLAKRGLFCNQFHTTALCSPTRAALLTGRNHHSVATGVIQEMATGYPGYCGIIPKGCATFAELLKQTGYGTTEGVIFALGGDAAGFSLFFWEGKARFHYNWFGIRRYDITSPKPLAPGKHAVVVNITPEAKRPGGPANVTMAVDGKEVGRVRLEEQVPQRCGTECIDVGMDCVSPVCDDYEHLGLFPFTGTIEAVTLDLPDVTQPSGLERLELATKMD